MNLSNTYPIRNPSVVSKIMQSETVVVVPERGKAEILNELGGFIWARIDGKRSVDAIVTAVCAEYTVEKAVAEQDAVHFLQDMETKGAIQLANQPL